MISAHENDNPNDAAASENEIKLKRERKIWITLFSRYWIHGRENMSYTIHNKNFQRLFFYNHKL